MLLLCSALLVVLGRFVDSFLVVSGRLGGRCWPFFLVFGGLGGVFWPSWGALRGVLGHLGRSWGRLGRSWGRLMDKSKQSGKSEAAISRFLDRLGRPRGTQNDPKTNKNRSKNRLKKRSSFRSILRPS